MTKNRSEPKNQESGRTIKVPDEFYDALFDLRSKMEKMRSLHEVRFSEDYDDPESFLMKQCSTKNALDEYITNRHNCLTSERPAVNKYNLIYLRDTWLRFAIDARWAAEFFACNDLIHKAWSCLNIATYHLARVHMIIEIDARIKDNISKKKFKSKEVLSQQTINEKKLLVGLFFKNSPELGWKNLKLALHEIRPHLIKEMQDKKPKDNQQEVERASEELLQKLGKWMRTDLNFKSQIDRHIHNKIVPDLSKLD